MNNNNINPSAVIPEMTRRLIIINALIWLAQMLWRYKFGTSIADMFGMHFWAADAFNPVQLLTYMFLHSTEGINHVFFNMFALWMFGGVIERVWGQWRLLVFYLVCGLTAALAQQLIWHLEFREILALPAGTLIDIGRGLPISIPHLLDKPVTVGASGAVFGVLLAYGMLFPNSLMFLLFVPIPIKAKYMVFFYGLAELYYGVHTISTGSNIAHFAHLGGMIGGFILIRLWRKHGRIDGPYN